MNILDRFLLAVCMLCLAAASLFAAVLPTGLVPPDFAAEQVRYIMSRWETSAVAAIFLVVSLYFLRRSIQRAPRKVSYDEAIVVQGENGQVRVAVQAVKALVEKTALHEAGVNAAKADVKVESKRKESMEMADVSVKLRLSVAPQANVPTLGSRVQEEIREVLKQSIGLPVEEIVVFVDTIAQEQKKRAIQ